LVAWDKTPSAIAPARGHCTLKATAALFFVDEGEVPESVLDADESVVVAADPISETANDEEAASPVGEVLPKELADDGRSTVKGTSETALPGMMGAWIGSSGLGCTLVAL